MEARGPFEGSNGKCSITCRGKENIILAMFDTATPTNNITKHVEEGKNNMQTQQKRYD